ncbi:MAG TPA: hypothetical protein VFI52_03665 [Gemmatimonadaceae bacterium]|nr:hypothetical protein [Gemmatimonadaceae bacterium]
MILPLRAVTRRAMSWSFVLVSLFLPLKRAAAAAKTGEVRALDAGGDQDRMIRDRHAVGELLTTTQVEELDRLQRELMTGGNK